MSLKAWIECIPSAIAPTCDNRIITVALDEEIEGGDAHLKLRTSKTCPAE